MAFLKLWQVCKAFPQEDQRSRMRRKAEELQKEEQVIEGLLRLALEVRSKATNLTSSVCCLSPDTIVWTRRS